MRFNKQEIVALASQTSQNFDREGVLVLKEKQDGFFRRTEGSTTRWFRLRGNLLFYLRNAEQLSEPVGVIVLGNHQIKIQPPDENGHWPFHIVWDNGMCYKMATLLESERTFWLKAIQSAAYDCLETKVSFLKEKLNRARQTIDVTTLRLQRGVIMDMNEIPLCELALSCDNLLCDTYGRPPSPMIVIYVKNRKGLCVQYNSTEIIETCSNPSFSKTILFRACDGLAGDTLVRLVAYDVRERVSGTMVPLGRAALLLSTIQEAQRLRIALTSNDNKTVGFVTLNGWSLEPSYIGTSPSHTNDKNSVDIPQKVLCHRRSQSLPPRLGLKLKFPSIGTLLKHNFVNSHQVTYRFHSGLGGDITVHEIMAEAKLCFFMPIQLLDIFIQREKEMLHEILSVGEMDEQWKTKQLQLINTHVSLLRHYWHSKKSLLNVPEGKFFKESSRKDDASLEFAPINLHLQRMWVHNDTLNKTGFHDIITVGAFTAHTHKAEKSGGLIRLVQQVKDINSTKAAFNSATASKIQAEYDNCVAAKRIRDETTSIVDKIVHSARHKQTSEIASLMEMVASKTRTLLMLCDPCGVEESLNFISCHRLKESHDGPNGNAQVSIIKKLSEQLSMFENANSELESISEYSNPSSNDTSPTNEIPTLSASVPNIFHNKTNMKDSTSIRDMNEGAELEFHNDYFKNESHHETSTRCSSLRLAKNKLDEAQSLSFDHSVNNTMKKGVKPDFKSSASLEQVSYKTLMNNAECNQKKDIDRRRESLSLANLGHRFDSSTRDYSPRASHPLTVGIEDALSNLGNAAQKIMLQDEDSNVETNEALVDGLLTRACELRARTDEFLGKLRVSHAALRMRCEAPQWTRASALLQIRRDTCFSQALTTATAGLLCWLSSVPHDVVLKLLTCGLGPLYGFEGLLSLYSTEKAMWGDMVVAVEDLHTVLFTLVKSSQCPSSIPQVSGVRGSLTVYIPISDSLYAKFDSKEHLSFTMTAVFFNIGINEKATLAEALGETTPQYQSNCDNFDRLSKYYHKYRKIFPEDIMNVARTSSRTKPLEEVMENLKIVVHKKTPKNVELLHLTSLATRQMNGIRFTSCKSAKDRTGMSATLEQCNILASEYHVAEHEFRKALHVLRSEGCRRHNAYKNIRVRMFAFTKKQVIALPHDYRPPPGTYGSTQT